MRTVAPIRLATIIAASVLPLLIGGCTSPREYVQNGFKVGPNYCPAPAPVASHWIDANDARISSSPADLAHWWCVFNDPVLNRLVDCAYRQNLSLRQAAFRVLETRAQLAIARGEFFPQTQTNNGSYQRIGVPVTGSSPTTGARFFNEWNYGFNLAWELDFWGRLRRAIAAGEDNLDASVANYDQAIVTMLGDIAENYVTVRTDQERIRLLRDSVAVQQGVFNYIDVRLKAGYKVTQLDWDQAKQNLKATEAGIPALEINLRQSENALCMLLGIPPMDLENLLGTGPIPTTPPEVAIGIPADLLRRRPDVRQAERLAAAQAEQIGIAEAQFYPIISITGDLNWQAQNFKDLFTSAAFNGSVGPQFQWNILNYGRIKNNVILQDATFKELVVVYQQTVLQAGLDVENGIATFLKAQVETKLLQESVQAANDAVKIVVLQYEKGEVDFNRYATIEQALVTQQDSMAQAEGQIPQGLIAMYRGLGGGWQMRCQPAAPVEPTITMPAVPPNQEIPMPQSSAKSPEAIPTPPTAPAPLQEPAVPAPMPGPLPKAPNP
jgi:NodT family efflux transporter outer membrane factor (OMF) lipoprotein